MKEPTIMGQSLQIQPVASTSMMYRRLDSVLVPSMPLLIRMQRPKNGVELDRRVREPSDQDWVEHDDCDPLLPLVAQPMGVEDRVQIDPGGIRGYVLLLNDAVESEDGVVELDAQILGRLPPGEPVDHGTVPVVDIGVEQRRIARDEDVGGLKAVRVLEGLGDDVADPVPCVHRLYIAQRGVDVCVAVAAEAVEAGLDDGVELNVVAPDGQRYDIGRAVPVRCQRAAILVAVEAVLAVDLAVINVASRGRRARLLVEGVGLGEAEVARELVAVGVFALEAIIGPDDPAVGGAGIVVSASRST